MQISSKYLVLLLTLVILSSAKGNVKSARIVYGEDNRIETYNATKFQKRLAKSTAGMFKNLDLVSFGQFAMMPPKPISDSWELCSDERFSKQPSAALCSGFLVGPDLLVTAGHCIINQEACDGATWVFDYKVNKKTNRTNIIIPNKNIYKCSKVIEAIQVNLESGNKRDFSLIKLDRVVVDRAPLTYRTTGKVSKKTEMLVIGHPSGLPQKIAGNGYIFDNTLESTFKTNLDTFGGNSGSAVFDAKSGQVEGILVRGAKDYNEADCGIRVNKVVEDIQDKDNLGEWVSRITDIPTLVKTKQLIAASKVGNLKQVELLSSELRTINLYDNAKNNALHIAIKNGHNDIVDLLINKKININAQNLKGETPLHMAAFVNNHYVADLLVEKGANILIKDNFGAYASERTNYFAFRLRSKLRRNQEKEIKRRKEKK
ncbi:MAG: trypsin-like serine protease [Halobacteriovoraceae bacterium]|jgi:V8-like Glu-specific endopeptidase|nr:trypsin-like serine protease [Halobacteriovoraceae bacterium]